MMSSRCPDTHGAPTNQAAGRCDTLVMCVVVCVLDVSVVKVWELSSNPAGGSESMRLYGTHTRADTHWFMGVVELMNIFNGV